MLLSQHSRRNRAHSSLDRLGPGRCSTAGCRDGLAVAPEAVPLDPWVSALGAAAYAAKAAGVASPDKPAAVEAEIQWQLGQASARVRDALRALPPMSVNRSGALGQGLLSPGELGAIIPRFAGGPHPAVVA